MRRGVNQLFADTHGGRFPAVTQRNRSYVFDGVGGKTYAALAGPGGGANTLLAWVKSTWAATYSWGGFTDGGGVVYWQGQVTAALKGVVKLPSGAFATVANVSDGLGGWELHAISRDAAGLFSYDGPLAREVVTGPKSYGVTTTEFWGYNRPSAANYLNGKIARAAIVLGTQLSAADMATLRANPRADWSAYGHVFEFGDTFGDTTTLIQNVGTVGAPDLTGAGGLVISSDYPP